MTTPKPRKPRRPYATAVPSTELARRIGQARVTAGMTQIDLAKAVGVSLATIPRWEYGQVVPRFDEMQRIASTLKQPLAYFIEP